MAISRTKCPFLITTRCTSRGGAVAEILPHAPGFMEFTAHGWCLERSGTYLFTIVWQRLEDHTEGFRGSELFTRWRTFIGPHFPGPPVVEHFRSA